MSPQVLYLNVLDQQHTRYIELGQELVAYLTEKYGEDIDFRVTVREHCEDLFPQRLKPAEARERPMVLLRPNRIR